MEVHHHGYDAVFVNEVTDHLKCVVCQMVLKDPVQIMGCGHRFCQKCFERIQNYARQLNTELCCPIDRKVVNVQMVFEDAGIARMIGDLQVKCGCHGDGCVWVGDLRYLQEHEHNCQHHLQKNVDGLSLKEDGSSALLKDLLKRMQLCEERMVSKEKEYAHMKINIHELKQCVKKRDEEMKTMKDTNIELEREIKIMKELNQLRKEQVEKLQNEITSTRDDMNKLFDHKNAEVKELNDRLDGVNDKIKDDMKNLRDHVNMCQDLTTANITRTESLINDVIKNKTDEFKVELDKLQNKVKSFNNVLVRSLKERDNELEELTSHVKNIEGVLFCAHAPKNEGVQLKWVLQNYQHHCEIVEEVESPVFFPSVDGYSFKLVVSWEGIKKKYLDCI